MVRGVARDPPRLETVWELGLHNISGMPTVYLRAQHLLCRDEECIELTETSDTVRCWTRECEEFVRSKLGTKVIESVARVSATREPAFDPPLELAEVKMLVKRVRMMPGCLCDFWLDSERDEMQKLNEILVGSPEFGKPHGPWRFYVVDGGIVALVSHNIVTICLKPECDTSRCRNLAKDPSRGCSSLSRFPKIRMLVELAENLQELAQMDWRMLVGLLVSLQEIP